jgi:hypothetical protein
MLFVRTPNLAAVSACPNSCKTTEAKMANVRSTPTTAALAVLACWSSASAIYARRIRNVA